MYVQGDQASIIGGAINYVKELEQLLQSLQARRHARRPIGTDDNASAAAVAPFADFFTFPQYTMRAPDAAASASANDAEAVAAGNADADTTDIADAMVASSGSKQSSVAEIEVTIVESHASLKALTRRRPRQLLRLVAGLQGHRLAVLHLNATGAGHMALYSLSLKVYAYCTLLFSSRTNVHLFLFRDHSLRMLGRMAAARTSRRKQQLNSPRFPCPCPGRPLQTLPSVCAFHRNDEKAALIN